MLRVEKDLCIGCGQCARDCPVGAIEIDDNIADISFECIECGECQSNCPVSCITDSEV